LMATPQERARAIVYESVQYEDDFQVGEWNLKYLENSISKAIEAAVREEREACAALADKLHSAHSAPIMVTASSIATLIRARGAK